MSEECLHIFKEVGKHYYAGTKFWDYQCEKCHYRVKNTIHMTPKVCKDIIDGNHWIVYEYEKIERKK